MLRNATIPHGKTKRKKTKNISIVRAKRTRCKNARAGFKINMISSINNRGKLHFMVYEENMHADLLITFLERLIKSCDKKIILILDNLRITSC